MRFLALVPDAFGGHGGISVYNRDFLSALCDNPDCEEVVAIPRLMPNPPEILPAKLTYVTTGLNGKFHYILSLLKVIGGGGRFNLIVCGHINLLPLAFLARILTGCPILLEIYGIDAWQPTESKLTNMLVSKVDAFVSISEITSKRFLSWSESTDVKGYILPNAIHLDKYGIGPKSPEMLKRYGLEDRIVLLTFGRLVSQERAKGFDEVLEILPDLAREIPKISYLIAGKGDDMERLRDKAKTFGVEDRVVFSGFVSEVEKSDLYRLADVYVMPSRGEGFGFVFLEAMACGIPVIASNVDGSFEAVRGGLLGQVVDPDSSEQLKKTILKSLSSEKKIPKGLCFFSYPNYSRRLGEIISKIIAAK